MRELKHIERQWECCAPTFMGRLKDCHELVRKWSEATTLREVHDLAVEQIIRIILGSKLPDWFMVPYKPVLDDVDDFHAEMSKLGLLGLLLEAYASNPGPGRTRPTVIAFLFGVSMTKKTRRNFSTKAAVLEDFCRRWGIRAYLQGAGRGTLIVPTDNIGEPLGLDIEQHNFEDSISILIGYPCLLYFVPPSGFYVNHGLENVGYQAIPNVRPACAGHKF